MARSQGIVRHTRQFLLGHRALLVVFSLGLGLLAWHWVAGAQLVPVFMLPSPGRVVQRGLQAAADGTLWLHGAVTLTEVSSGLALGVTAGSVLGYLLAKSRCAERILTPYIVASQAIPIVAIAPLLVIWFGPGLFSKVLICALIVFFPVLINAMVGLHSAPEELRELMRSLQASRWQTFILLEAPAALPVFLGGLRVGATLSVVGAVVGEFVGAKYGLGFLVNMGRGLYDTPLVFVAVFTLIGMALSLYGLVALLEYVLLGWQRRPEQISRIEET